MEGQLRLFERDVAYTFMRKLGRGDVFVVGTPTHHSAEFEVTVNHPARQVMGVRYQSWRGEVKDTSWEYRDHDVCIVVEQGEQGNGKTGEGTSV